MLIITDFLGRVFYMVSINTRSMYINKSMKTTINVQQILHFLATKLKSDYVDIPEVHDFWEMAYLESGEAVVIADDNKIHMLPGDVIFHKPGVVHYTQTINGVTPKLFFISFCANSKAMSLFDGLKISLDSEQKKMIYKMYDEARNIFVNGYGIDDESGFSSQSLLPDAPLGAQQLFKIHLEEFLILVGRLVEKQEKVITYQSREELEKIIFQKMVEKVSEALYSELTIEDLCSSLNYSRTYLSVLFKKHSGMSVMQYYNSLKIKEAKRLIKNGKNSLFEIAEMLKFNNQYYFSKVFKKIEGVSPSEYKYKK